MTNIKETKSAMKLKLNDYDFINEFDWSVK